MSTSSSSSSSSSEEVEGGDGGAGFEAGPATSRGRRRRRGHDHGRGGVWLEPFVEALAIQVTVDASRSIGRLAAAPALSNIFQVCSSWRAASRSNRLWRNLTRQIWKRDLLVHNSWREEFIYRHLTAMNFRLRRYAYTTLQFVATGNNDSLSCRRLAVSDQHLAAGFADGVVRLFHLPSRLNFSTLHPHYRDRLGQFSTAVSGIILSQNRIVFASLDGDIHVALIGDPLPLRRAHRGDVVNDGVLVDFTGSNQWWVGPYVGVPGRAFHVWNSETEELLFVGGSLTDQEAVLGWHLLTQLTQLVGRVRITNHESAVACTGLRIIAFDLRHQGVVLWEQNYDHRGVILGSMDANDESFLIVDNRGLARVRRVTTSELICQFSVRGASQRGVLACINGGYALMCVGGVIRVWEIEHGEYLYALWERVYDASAIVTNERHVAVCSNDATIHLWDFGA